MLIEAAQVFFFVNEWIGWVAPALSDAVGQLNHLVDGLFPVEAHDVLVEDLAGLLFRFAGAPRKQFDEEREHDLGPALADEGKGAIEVEESVAEMRTRAEAGAEFD